MNKALSKRRKQQGYTQRDLAQIVGCTFVMISQIENGKSGVSLSLALKIAQALNYRLDPTGQIQTAFDHVMNLTVKQAAQMAKSFNVEFDSEKLFEVV